MASFYERSTRVTLLNDAFLTPRRSKGYGHISNYAKNSADIDIANCTSENRFKYVENLIIKLHKETCGRDVIYANFCATFDDWKDRSASIKTEVHKQVVDYYANLNFVERYGLSAQPWIHDKDIEALIQVLQVMGRAKAAVKLEKFETEIDGVAAKLSSVESNGRYYRKDVITLSISFDRLRISIQIENDRSRKRQATIDKMAEAPFKAVAKTYEIVGCILGISILFAPLIVLIMFILEFFGITK